VPELSGARILEIGAGDGRMTWMRGAGSVVGVDPEGEALTYLLEDLPPGLHGRVFPVCGVGERLPLPSHAFDVALLAWSL
jgi:ubiquinone/menaquinone biosynthesis C-methylase UbiE